MAASTTGLRHRVETFFPLPFLGLAHAVLAVSDPRVPHVKVATSPPVVRELYLSRIGDDDPAVRGPPVHDRGALGATRVGLDQEIRALLDILVVALGSRHQLTRPFAAEALFVCRLRPLLPDCFSTTASEPIEGTTVDSSPVDHRTRKSDPVTPVTTPSRGASPTFLEGTCTRSPMTAIPNGATPQRVWPARSHTFRLQTLLARPLSSWLVRRSPVAALRQPTPPPLCARVRSGVMTGPGVFLPAGRHAATWANVGACVPPSPLFVPSP